LKRYLQSFFSIIYPDICTNCSRVLIQQEETLCTHCFLDIPVLDYHLQENNPIILDLPNGHFVSNAFVFMKYNKEGLAPKLLNQLKYKGNNLVGSSLGKWFSHHMFSDIEPLKLDYIIPVPIHISKKRHRGYNQVEVIARELETILKIPMETNFLGRRRTKKAQVKKSKFKRWEKSEEQYYLRAGSENLKDSSVLLVDDVITTGATIDSIICLLNALGVAGIYIACIATGK